MNINAQILVWFVACTAGLLTATMSLRYAHLLYEAVHHRPGIDPEIVGGRHHIRTTQTLLVIGWVLLLSIGIYAVLQPPLERPVQPLPQQLITWTLIGVPVVWSIKTVNDFLYTRRRWQMPTPARPTREMRRQVELARLTEARVQVAEALQDQMALTGQDTNERVIRVEEATVRADEKAQAAGDAAAGTASELADTAHETERRLSKLENGK